MIGVLAVSAIVFLVVRRRKARHRAEIIALVDRRILDVLVVILNREHATPP